MQLNPQAKTAKYFQIKLEELKFRDALKNVAETAYNSDLQSYYYRRNQ